MIGGDAEALGVVERVMGCKGVVDGDCEGVVDETGAAGAEDGVDDEGSGALLLLLMDEEPMDSTVALVSGTGIWVV